MAGISGGVKFLTPRLLNELKALALCNQDLVFATKEQALEFISKKFPNIPEEVAQKRSAEGWNFDSHPIKGSTESIDHINMYSKELGFRIHITWRK